MDDPHVPLTLASGGSFGYRDTPEGSTPFPGPDAAALAAAEPLLIARQVVRIDRTGPTRVLLGHASLANGIIQNASFGLADPWPDTVILRGGVTLDVTPVAGGDPIRNIFEHGWHDGVERVAVVLTFDVAIMRPGASIEVVDVDVR